MRPVGRVAELGRWAMHSRLLITVCAMSALLGCVSTSPVEPPAAAQLSTATPIIRPDPFSPDAPSWWESRVQMGMTEDEVRSVLGGRYREPRAMSGAELVAWAEARAIFVGSIHRDPNLLAALRADIDYHVYSRQGTPTTANQMTILFSRATNSDWRVVNRAVRPRPCF